MNENMTPGELIISILNEIEELCPNGTVEMITELVRANESGIALEILCSHIFEYAIELSNENISKIKRAAYLMNIPLSELDIFSQ